MIAQARRVQLLELDPELLLTLFSGGTFRLPPAVPPDSRCAGVWVDSARYLVELGFWSDSSQPTRIGHALPVVASPAVERLFEDDFR